MKNRIEIEQAENGYSLKVWKEEDRDDDNDYGYYEPKIFIAKTTDEILDCVEKTFNKEK